MNTLEMQQECQRLLNLRPLFLECKASRKGPDAEVVEIALIESNGSVMLDELVRPKQEIEPEMAKVHGISNEIAQYALPWADVWQQAKKLINRRMIAVFELETQLSCIRHSHTIGFLRWDPDPAKFFSIQKLHAEYHNEWERSKNTYRLFPLEEAAELVGLPSAPQDFRRRALEDARLARGILIAMAGWKVA